MVLSGFVWMHHLAKNDVLWEEGRLGWGHENVCQYSNFASCLGFGEYSVTANFFYDFSD